MNNSKSLNKSTESSSHTSQTRLVSFTRVLKSAVLGLALSLTAIANAQAQSDNSGTFFGKSAPGKWIIGAKAGRIDPNDPEVDDADAVGIVLGYQFAKAIGDSGGSSSFEIEYLTGDTTPIVPGTSYDVDVLNMFFTYRSAGTVFYKLKGGLSYTSIDQASISAGRFEDDEVAAAVGIGLGYRIQDLGVVELEYSQEAGNADLGILALNALLQF